MAHSRLSPSAAYRWRKCPGSVKMEAQFPNTDNEYSLKGTAVHTVLAKAFEDRLDTCDSWLNQHVEVDTADGGKTSIRLVQEDIEAANVALDYLHRRVQEINPTTVDIEVKSDPAMWLDRDDMSGTADFRLMTSDFIEVIDYKHGAGVSVDAVDNDQLLIYGLGSLGGQSTIRMTIVQPRGRHPDGPVRSWDQESWELMAQIPKLKADAADTDIDGALLMPHKSGEGWCRFCKARGTCPALAQSAMDVFKPVTPEPTSEPVATPAGNGETKTPWSTIDTTLGRPVEMLSVQEITNILEKSSLISAWLKGVKDKATELAEAGTEIPGYKLVAASTHRKWMDTEAAIIKKLSSVKDREGNKVAKKDVMVEKPISPAQAEKVLKPRVGERTWRNVEKLIIKPEGAPTLVPVTDKREAIKTAEQVFEPAAPQAAAMPWE